MNRSATPAVRPVIHAPTREETLHRSRGRQAFDAGEVLRRTGFRVRHETAQTGDELAGIGRGLQKLGAGDFTGPASGAFLTVVASLLALILLDLLLSPRGSTITAAALKWTGGAFARVVSPTDPLVAAGSSAPAAAGGEVTTSSGSSAPKNVPGGAGGGTAASEYGQPLYPTPSGRLAEIPGTTLKADSAYTPFIGWIANHFGVTVTSGYRTPSANAAVGGAPDSDHLKGLAADFGGSAAALTRLYAWAVKYGFPYVESPAQAVAQGEGAHVHISFYRPS